MGLGTKLSVNSERRAFAEHRRDRDNPEAVKSSGTVVTALLSEGRPQSLRADLFPF